MVVKPMNFDEVMHTYFDQLKDSKVKQAMAYSLFAGGKRIRPTLLYEVLKGYGIKEDVGNPFAAALEMIHTYSLIHDDLPAMDNDDLRRGRPTCHKQFDEATAILAGDGLLTYAFEIASQSDLDTKTVVQIIRTLASLSGSNGMILGQCLDMSESIDTTWKQVEEIHHYKTGCLLTAPFLIGGYIAKVNQSQLEILEKIGYLVGLAFQIQDDILDYTSSAEELGKTNSDDRNQKSTSITLLGLEKSQKMMNACYQQACQLLTTLDNFDETHLIDLIQGIKNRRK